MPRKAKYRQVLERTREILAQPYAWGKGRYFGRRKKRDGTEVGQYCLIGAMQQAARTDLLGVSPKTEEQARQELLRCIQEDTGLHFLTVEAANDQGSTRKRDVLRWLDCAIGEEK